jgi:hypothetical protein
MVSLKCKMCRSDTHLRRRYTPKMGHAFVVGYQICLALDMRGR